MFFNFAFHGCSLSIPAPHYHFPALPIYVPLSLHKILILLLSLSRYIALFTSTQHLYSVTCFKSDGGGSPTRLDSTLLNSPPHCASSLSLLSPWTTTKAGPFVRKIHKSVKLADRIGGRFHLCPFKLVTTSCNTHRPELRAKLSVCSGKDYLSCDLVVVVEKSTSSMVQC